jgi:hypothetical protein
VRKIAHRLKTRRGKLRRHRLLNGNLDPTGRRVKASNEIF